MSGFVVCFLLLFCATFCLRCYAATHYSLKILSASNPLIYFHYNNRITLSNKMIKQYLNSVSFPSMECVQSCTVKFWKTQILNVFELCITVYFYIYSYYAYLKSILLKLSRSTILYFRPYSLRNISSTGVCAFYSIYILPYFIALYYMMTIKFGRNGLKKRLMFGRSR